MFSVNNINKGAFWIYGGVVITLAILFFKNANHNWDLIPYSSLVQQMKTADTSVVQQHHQLFETLEAELPKTSFEKLTQGKQYRVRNYTEPYFFESQLGFYRIKWGYTLFNTGFSYLVGSNARGVSLTSVLAWLATAILLPIWLKKAGIKILWSLGTSAFIILQPFLIEGARTASPDMLSTAIILFCFYFLWQKCLTPALLLAVFAVLVRPDNAALSGLSCLYIWVQFPHRTPRLKAAAAAILILLVVAKLVAFNGGASLVGALYQDGYLQHVIAGLSSINESFLPMAFLATLVFFAIGVFKIKESVGRLIFLIWLATAIKFAMVPVLDNRFYYPIILLPFIFGAVSGLSCLKYMTIKGVE